MAKTVQMLVEMLGARGWHLLIGWTVKQDVNNGQTGHTIWASLHDQSWDCYRKRIECFVSPLWNTIIFWEFIRMAECRIVQQYQCLSLASQNNPMIWNMYNQHIKSVSKLFIKLRSYYYKISFCPLFRKKLLVYVFVVAFYISCGATHHIS